MIKKILIVLILSLTISIFTIKERKIINADEEKTVTALGAQIRTEKIDEKYGIRFSFKTQNIDISEVNYFVTLITRYADKDDLTIENGLDEENDKVISIIADSFFEENIFVGSLVKIPGEKGERDFNPIEDELIARGVVVLKDGTKIYSDEITRNVVDVARNEYSLTDSPTDVINELARNRRIKVVHSDDSVDYYGTPANYTTAGQQDGDKVYFSKAAYITTDFTISQNNMEFYGLYADEPINSEGERENEQYAGESEFTKSIIIGSGVSNVLINGFKFSGANSIKFENETTETTTSNISITNCIMDYSGSYSIVNSENKGKFENIEIRDNYIKGTKTTAQTEQLVETGRFTGIYFLSPVGNIDITNNRIIGSNMLTRTKDGSSKTTYAVIENDFAIQLRRCIDDTFINIKDNHIDHKCSYAVISIGSSGTEKEYRIFVNIENNELGVSNTDILGGNGIWIAALKAGSSVSILHNTKFRISSYYSPLSIKEGTNGSSVGKDSLTDDIRVDVLYNHFFCGLVADNDAPAITLENEEYTYRNTTTSSYIRLGFGFSGTSKVVISTNYYSQSNDKYVVYSCYSSISTAAPVASFYGTNGGEVTAYNDRADSSSAANTAYTSYLSTYNSNISTITNENSYEGSYAPYIIYCIKNNIPFTPSGFTA